MNKKLVAVTQININNFFGFETRNLTNVTFQVDNRGMYIRTIGNQPQECYWSIEEFGETKRFINAHGLMSFKFKLIINYDN